MHFEMHRRQHKLITQAKVAQFGYASFGFSDIDLVQSDHVPVNLCGLEGIGKHLPANGVEDNVHPLTAGKIENAINEIFIFIVDTIICSY